MRECDLCGATDLKQVLELKYYGEEKPTQKLWCCKKCGLIAAEEKVPFAFNEQAVEKDKYLNRIIKSFIEKDNELKEDEVQIFSECLEHSTDIIATVELIGKSKREYTLIEVPIYDVYSYNSTDLYGYFIKSHNYYFGIKTIEYIMNQLGYGLVNFSFELGKKFNMPMIFPCFVSLWRKQNIVEIPQKEYSFAVRSDIEQYIISCRRRLNEYSIFLNDKIPNSVPIAIWGTSNYAKKLVGMTSLFEKNIVKVYDGDSSKWGKFFGDYIIEKFDEQDIKQRVIEKIVIASNTSYDAIKDNLVQKYSIDDSMII